MLKIVFIFNTLKEFIQTIFSFKFSAKSSLQPNVNLSESLETDMDMSQKIKNVTVYIFRLPP